MVVVVSTLIFQFLKRELGNLIVTGSDVNEIETFKGKMMKECEMTDLLKLTYVLGMEFTEIFEGCVMHQMKYASDILKRFKMVSCNPLSSPTETNFKMVVNEEEELVDPTLFKHIVGSLRYMCNSRPDIAYAVGIIRRFMSEPRASHLLAAKRVMRYIKGTLELVGNKRDRKSTSGYLFKFLNAPIS
ncbi:uncharacterized mitochondrial protein AtMg00810-like [Medicago truncatula]|uniref:uncharacterized mitochondrial protein AtMg00810-like n=1 Tax=Medicago truncatula TaxID=3880 RepID=UPI000D2F1FC1|nr:uncharacterized mitochondrial protein AtMg00810-like [Medicago truncatula]